MGRIASYKQVTIKLDESFHKIKPLVFIVYNKIKERSYEMNKRKQSYGVAEAFSIIADEILNLKSTIKKLEKENADLKAENARLNEYTDTLTDQDKDTCGELEAYRNENFTLKAEIEKLKKQMEAVQKICFDSCL